MSTELPPGLILLSQPGFFGITPQDIRDALQPEYQRLPTISCEIDTIAELDDAFDRADWSTITNAIREQFLNRVEPQCKKYPGYRIAYFGTAPIALTFYLGTLIGTWQQVETFQHHHRRRSWKHEQDPSHKAPSLLPTQWSTDRADTRVGEALIRVSTSHRVDRDKTREVLSNAVVEVDLSLEEPTEDAFESTAEIRPVIDGFKTALDQIGDRFPGVHTIHLFASTQPAVSLLLGTQFNQRIHPQIQTYQFQRGDTTHHRTAALIGTTNTPALPSLSADDLARAQQDRVALNDTLVTLDQHLRDRAYQRHESWAHNVVGNDHDLLTGSWRALPSLPSTLLGLTRVDLITTAAADAFRLNAKSDQWQLDDHWLRCLAARLPDVQTRNSALRMLLLHESVHRGPQRLTQTSSEGIGRFARILEEIDYQADLWSMLHEYRLWSAHTDSPRLHLMKLIRSATECMWAFDDLGARLQKIQPRRLHRYLLWYWQYLQLEYGVRLGTERTLRDVVAVLAQRPVLEIAGPELLTQNDRVYFRLSHLRNPELAVYHQGQLFRHGERVGFSIAALFSAVEDRNGDRVLSVLRGAFEQTMTVVG